jgi:cell division protein FtsI (penicillin-binding protein 3)
LQPKFTEYAYEAGSVMKPISIAIALDKNKITPDTLFNTGYKRFDITGGQHISDDDYFDSLSVTDIIVHSSNIGSSQISWLLSGQEFREGLLQFGVARPSGIDLSRDLPGSLKPLKLLNHKMHRANSSFGYGMTITFAQLIKAYSAFNNNGIAVTPRIIDYLEDAQEHRYTLEPTIPDLKAVSQKTAEQIKTILKEVVSRGTGVKGQYPGLEIGGKTGTAHIAKNGHYVKEYHSSFYGFANDDEGHKYTIGALVIRAKKPYAYFASNSAVPTFKKMVEILVELDYLKPTKIEAPQESNDTITTLAPAVAQEKSIVIPKAPVQAIKKSDPKPAPSVKELFKPKAPVKTPLKPVITQPKIEKIPPNSPPKEKSFEELF